jgi:hypothetical protein
MRVRAWRIPEHAILRDKPLSIAELTLKANDISTGGLGVSLLPKNDEPPKVIEGERLRVQIEHADQDLIIEGRMLHRAGATPAGQIRAGIQFKKLENDLEGRQILAALTKIVGELQREEVRRMRLGLAKAG